MEKVKITTEFIKLGQFLKLVKLIDTGGQEKIFLLTKMIFVNGEKENRRGKKLFPGDVIKIEEREYLIE